MFKSVLNKTIISLSAALMLSSSLSAADCSKRAFDIKVNKEDTSAYEIINQLSKVCDFSVVYKDSYSKGILSTRQDGISIKNMHINGIFDLLIAEQGLDYDFSNNILKIQGLNTKTFKLDYITSVRKGSAITKANVESQASSSDSSSSSSSSGSSSDSDNMIETKEEFDFWKNIGKEISEIVQNSGQNIPITPPTINANAGLITVTSSNEILDRIETYLNQVQESLKKQVVIDVSIIEVSLNKSHKTGIDWTQFNLGFDTTGASLTNLIGNTANGTIILADKKNTSNVFWGKTDKGRWHGDENIAINMGINLTGMINFLKESGDVKVVSSPKIATLNNQQALITVGDTYNYKLKGSSTTTDSGSTGDADEEKSIFVGILLNILPEISDDNKIMLRINPSISELINIEDKKVKDGYRVVAPDTKQKKLSTVVQVRDGETIVLGGLITDSELFSKNGIPVLQDIPLLGKLFGSKQKSKEKTELVFVITPHVVDFTKDKEEVRKSLEDLGYSLALDYKEDLKPTATKNLFKEKAEEFDSINNVE
ncbi:MULTISPECIES: pilus (MSHA type) biogenesis protein MshL [unclassified Campylobacter]|uniref:pilus (MSHA type) biogenesis protein MshL n=1 Tax=unclassified Campylobacter TaxID=2593542 RepID=UPI001BD9D07A|nr:MULTISPECIES: pilus (MSHA type) biogenesis protein MshL [unclassified Campylobacter]MBZ7979033.1 pilus (MSHA type) biogenesis protein MshL [Campylobacter sp. RM12642]MBZ7990200.1 pilus (MSHA type) biogenesis protein MshL [Campylobacter sp. RM9331]MBZ7993158.1 pilus (MSHA type) biogenesis protein MshL [Campylobacter sp. RM9333]MBZ8006206.1 pilus (MSHA type) biogenesis protein MshL [Campylobacter sp. RM9332]MBZ8008209.1 pilus (MSHA type) biogenesis protein MshL [Campylobacter sp. RM9334]